MAVVSFICLLPVLLTMSGLPVYISVIISAVIAPAASLTELFTKKGWDTITVPIVSAILLGVTMAL